MADDSREDAAAPAPAPQVKKKKKNKGPHPLFIIQPISAFYLFLGASLLAALYAPIQDCDETFNYWEPTHYLSHGYGLQTWEYSPEYAIRSWVYTGLHAIAGNVRRLLPRSNKVAEFYFVRYCLAGLCALSQTLLWRSICLSLNPRIGLFFIAATIFSPGNFHASAAYLPSSFAMCMGMVGAAMFMNWRGGLKSSWGMFWFAVGGVVGWPFAAALCAPFLAEEGLLALFSDSEGFFQACIRVFRGVVAAGILVFFDMCINSFFYKKFAIVAWNIVKYNVFSSSGGPDLYGTEPWTFYFKNLLLNFNIWFIFALAALPLFALYKLANRSSPPTTTAGLRTIIFLTPFYLWLAIFTLQPHKEERFMYPAYPFLALNAAISSHILLTLLGHTSPSSLIGKVPAKLKLLFFSAFGFLAIIIGLLRIWGLYTAYAAPLSIYAPLAQVGHSGDTVCFGKEWYRFPSSYFLPRDMRAKFIRSEFRGLLPGEFAEARMGFGFWSGTWLVPSGMNDMNQEDLGKYVDVKTCQFLVDSQYPERTEETSPNEPDYISDKENWEEVLCLPFLDAASTGFVARALWTPEREGVPLPEGLRRKWGRHCLLRRKEVGVV